MKKSIFAILRLLKIILLSVNHNISRNDKSNTAQHLKKKGACDHTSRLVASFFKLLILGPMVPPYGPPSLNIRGSLILIFPNFKYNSNNISKSFNLLYRKATRTSRNMGCSSMSPIPLKAVSWSGHLITRGPG